MSGFSIRSFAKELLASRNNDGLDTPTTLTMRRFDDQKFKPDWIGQQEIDSGP